MIAAEEPRPRSILHSSTMIDYLYVQLKLGSRSLKAVRVQDSDSKHGSACIDSRRLGL